MICSYIFLFVFFLFFFIFFFFNDTATTEIYTLSLHDALPITDGVDASKDAPPAKERERIAARRFIVVPSINLSAEPLLAYGIPCRDSSHSNDKDVGAGIPPCATTLRTIRRRFAESPLSALRIST